MDSHTKEIVASNLTVAYLRNHPEIATEQEIIDTYRRFLELLAPQQSASGFTQGRWK